MIHPWIQSAPSLTKNKSKIALVEDIIDFLMANGQEDEFPNPLVMIPIFKYIWSNFLTPNKHRNCIHVI